jgi:Thioredoxin-like [2Fe-2S] ferredoxin
VKAWQRSGPDGGPHGAPDAPGPIQGAGGAYTAQARGRALDICQGLACREVGAEALLAALERLSGLRRGRTAEDGGLSLAAGICQGRCAIGPNASLNGRVFCVEGPWQAEALLKRALKAGRPRSGEAPEGLGPAPGLNGGA